MPLTRAFKSDDGQAVLIPAELAYEDMSVDLTITRTGDVIVIAPAPATMKEMIAKLRAMPKPPSVEVREPIEMPEREWD
jgi:antitoxin VapB